MLKAEPLEDWEMSCEQTDDMR